MNSNNIYAVCLAAGFGKRLSPLTDFWPKCLMPIHGRPLLDYWLCDLIDLNIRGAIVNTHYFSGIVKEFLNRPIFEGWVKIAHEDELLGTAGTLRNNAGQLLGNKLLLLHADNWVGCSLIDFIDYHIHRRPEGTLISMMTFKTADPASCGIVKLDSAGIVQEFTEKPKVFMGDTANGAIYILEPEVLEWIINNPSAIDFSTHVLPNFIGKIATWENSKFHRDIGSIPMLIAAQSDQKKFPSAFEDEWMLGFKNNKIHKYLKALMK